MSFAEFIKREQQIERKIKFDALFEIPAKKLVILRRAETLNGEIERFHSLDAEARIKFIRPLASGNSTYEFHQTKRNVVEITRNGILERRFRLKGMSVIKFAKLFIIRTFSEIDDVELVNGWYEARLSHH